METINYINGMQIEECFERNDISSYRLTGAELSNDYYIVSSSGTRHLLGDPSVIGYDVCTSMLPATSAMLAYLNNAHNLNSCSILNILRGGLNFPIEQACHAIAAPAVNVDFLSCERTFDSAGVPNGLQVKYSQVFPVPDVTIILGDIIASGGTLKYCLDKLVEQYRSTNCEIKRIVVFTIGGTRAMNIAEHFTKVIRTFWPNFEGFIVVFYEGIFGCYEPGDTGVSGFNAPLIDFIWQGGIVSPAFMCHVFNEPYALLEKCVIYDGGARRYNIAEHIEEVLDFWQRLLQRAEAINFDELLEEKLGHPLGASYDEWVEACHFILLPTNETKELFSLEKSYISKVRTMSLAQIVEQRIAGLQQDFKNFIEETSLSVSLPHCD